MDRVKISVNKHGSKLIVISGHHDCAGNPCDEETQKEQIKASVKRLKNTYPEIEMAGVWVNNEWKVSEI